MTPKDEKLVWRLSDLQEEPIDWLWPGRIAAGKTTLIDGDPCQGKSLLTLDLAARLTTGQPLPDGYVPPEPISVVLVGRQDGLHDTIMPRLSAAGADMSRIRVFGGRRRGSVWRAPSFPEDCDLLRETVEEAGARLIVLDPLIDFLSRRACNLNEQLVLQALMPLAQLAEETRAAMEWVRHLNKGGRGQRALYRGTGSIAISGIARTAFLVGESPQDKDLGVLACSKNSLEVWPPSLGFRILRNNQGRPVVDWTGPVDLTADELVLRPRIPHGAGLDEAKRFLQESLRTGPSAVADLQRRAHEAGISDGTLRRAKDQLNVQSASEGFGAQHQWYWSLPKEALLTPGEQHAEALKAAEEMSRRFFEDLANNQVPPPSP